MSCHYVECLTNKAGWKLFGLLSDSSWHSAVHPPHIHIKVPPHLLFYLLLGVEITGPLIPNKHPHTHTHDDCGHTQISVFLAWPCEISHLGLATALCRARVFTRGSTPITGWQTASPDQEMGGGGWLIFMLDVLLFAVATQKPILSPISFNWRSRLWNVCSD